MNRLALMCVLWFTICMLSAGLTWQQPITVLNYDNIEYSSQSLQTADGCHLILWWANDYGIPQYFLRLYDQQYQPLWDTPLSMPAQYGIRGMVETADSCFVLVFFNEGIKALKISRSGEYLWGSQGISVPGSLWMNVSFVMVSDLQGGVYISWCGEYSNRNRSAIQHIDATGNLSMASNGVSLEDSVDSFRTNLMILPDNSVLITWTLLYEVKMQRVNSTGQFIWPQTLSIASSTNYPRGIFCAFSDASFAFCLSHWSYLEVQRYDFSGNAMWPQAVTAITASNIYSYSVRAAGGSDNSVFVTAETNNNKYLQKIGFDGTIHYPGGIDLSAEMGYLSAISPPLPDDSGGCVVVACTYSSQPNIKAFQINAAGNATVFPVTDTVFYKKGLSAGRIGNSIFIEWHQRETLRGGIKVQILDQQMQPLLVPNGEELVFGSSGRVRSVQTAARSDGSSVIWQQTPLSPTQWDLYLQIYTLQGQSIFGAGGIRINRPGSSLSGSALVHCNDNHTMVVWSDQIGADRGTRYQIFDPSGNILLPESGLILGNPDQPEGPVSVSTHLGYWYIVWPNSNVLMGQKLSGTQALWGDGIQLTQPHPEIQDNIFGCNLEWPWLTWTMGTMRKPMFARIDDNGTVQPGFPAYGIGLPIQEDECNLFKHTFTVCNDNLHVVLGFSFISSPPEDIYQIIYFKHALYGSQGEILFPLNSLPVQANYNVFQNGNDVLIGDYYSNYRIRKYNNNGDLSATYTLPVPAFSNGGWEVLGSKFISNGDLLVLVRGYLQGAQTLRHFYVTPQWGLDLPEDNIVFNIGRYLPPPVSLLGDRAWIANAAGRDYSNNDAAGIFLQGVGSGGSLSPEEPQTPALPLLESCSPNPFNPTTRITYFLPRATRARITVYDLRGRKISVLLDSDMPAGRHVLDWDGKTTTGKNIASGVYILRLDADGRQHSRKVTLIK